MGNFSNKRYNWVRYRHLFVIGLIIVFSFISGGNIFAKPNLSCSFNPATIPVNGTVIVSCTGRSGYGFLQCAPFSQKVTQITAYFHYNSPTGEIRFSQSAKCDSSVCVVNFQASGFNEPGNWYILACLDRHCSFPYDDDSYCSSGYWGPIQVNPGTCGDGIINQPSEQCDDGNNISGDGCDANCQLETVVTPTPPTLPTGYDNPLRWNTVLEFLAYILRILFWVGIIILFFVLLLATYYVITSGGSSIRLLMAKKIFLWAFLGFVIILLGRVIIWFIQHL